MSKCKHDYKIVDSWDTGYINECSKCKKRYVYDVGVEEQRIKGFLAWIILITILLGIAIPIVEWIYMEIIK